MQRQAVAFIAVFASSAGLGLGCSDASSPLAEDDTVDTAESGLSGAEVAKIALGGALFFSEVPAAQGNGRACATCHVAEDGFQLTPARVEARWQALQKKRASNPNADDPLFRSIDANDKANDFTFLRQHALVRIGLQLPTDAEGNKLIWPLDDPGATSVDVWRSTPSIKNVAITAPYQADGRFATLEQQALGALQGHAEIKNNPKPSFLDAISAFEKTQFSSIGVARVSAALARGETPPDPDPTLNALEQAGKELFGVHCAVCHGGPTQTRPIPPLAGAQDIFVSKPVPPFAADLPFPAAPPLAVRLWAVRVPGAPAPVIRPSTDPGKALTSGRIDDFNQFDVPSLFGISKTAPYFHDNSAKNLEEVMLHYQSLTKGVGRVAAFPPRQILDAEVAPLIAYLKKI